MTQNMGRHFAVLVKPRVREKQITKHGVKSCLLPFSLPIMQKARLQRAFCM